MNYEEHVARNARLIILRQLAAETTNTLNDALLQRGLETFGHNKTREYVRTQIRWLADMGAVTLMPAGTAMIARLTQHGLDHVERRVHIEGVDRPSLGGG